MSRRCRQQLASATRTSSRGLHHRDTTRRRHVPPELPTIHTGIAFNVQRYASEVANELLWALEGLVED
ncbi:MAG: hypothetical protein IJ887_16240 [Prevotella sp.]|nr:hypothetical protein [Prevotella sp.]MBR3480897.1 hypothetical protein [Prevotella sp.]MBR6189667.1 hypothetical protein [Prevotella sp.]